MDGKPCTHSELIARVVALEAGLSAFKDLMAERDSRYALRAITQDAAVDTAMKAADKALIKAEASTERRLEALNELRALASDQATLLMPRSEYSVQHQALVDRVSVSETRITVIEGRSGGIKDAWGYLVGLVGAVIAAFAVYYHR